MSLQTIIFYSGIVLELLSLIGFVWTLLLFFLLLKFSNSKISVSYVPVISLTLATLGQFSLLSFNEILALLNVNVGRSTIIFGDFLFFPFWYGLMSSVILLALNRVALCLNISLHHCIFSSKWMLIFAICGWLWGCFIGGLAVFTTQYGENDLLFRLYADGSFTAYENNNNNNYNYDVNVNLTNSTNNIKKSINYILVVTETVNCITILSLLICYITVITHIRKSQQIIEAQKNDVLKCIANGIGIIVPIPAFANNQIVPNPQSYNNLPTTSTADAQSPTAPMFWSITLHFCLISCSVGFFGIFLLVSKFFINPYLILIQYCLHVFSSLTNVLLLSTINSKVKRRLIDAFNCCNCFRILFSYKTPVNIIL